MSYSKHYLKPTFIYIAIQYSVPGCVKIGMSLRPEVRLSNFKVGSAIKDYEIAYSTPMVSREFARRVELHFKNNYNSSGEWYEMSVEQAISIIERYKTTYTGPNSKFFNK